MQRASLSGRVQDFDVIFTYLNNVSVSIAFFILKIYFGVGVSVSWRDLDCVHTMPAQFENGRKFDDKNSLQDLMPKNSTYTLRIDLSRSKSVEKCSVFIFVECLNDAVSNLCRLRFRFQNLPFSKSAGKKCAVFV